MFLFNLFQLIRGLLQIFNSLVEFGLDFAHLLPVLVNLVLLLLEVCFLLLDQHVLLCELGLYRLNLFLHGLVLLPEHAVLIFLKLVFLQFPIQLCLNLIQLQFELSGEPGLLFYPLLILHALRLKLVTSKLSSFHFFD